MIDVTHTGYGNKLRSLHELMAHLHLLMPTLLHIYINKFVKYRNTTDLSLFVMKMVSTSLYALCIIELKVTYFVIDSDVMVPRLRHEVTYVCDLCHA